MDGHAAHEGFDVGGPPACTSISFLPFSLLILMITPSRRGRGCANQLCSEPASTDSGPPLPTATAIRCPAEAPRAPSTARAPRRSAHQPRSSGLPRSQSKRSSRYPGVPAPSTASNHISPSDADVPQAPALPRVQANPRVRDGAQGSVTRSGPWVRGPSLADAAMVLQGPVPPGHFPHGRPIAVSGGHVRVRRRARRPGYGLTCRLAPDRECGQGLRRMTVFPRGQRQRAGRRACPVAAEPGCLHRDCKTVSTGDNPSRLPRFPQC